MQSQPKIKQIGLSIFAVILWFLTIGMGLQIINSVGYIFALLFVWAGGSTKVADVLAWPLTCIMAILMIAFMIFTGEYHRKNVGQAKSWRLFAWSIAVELIILIIHYILR
jgi:hypothetical protein